MASSSASSFSDEIPNNNTQESYIINFPFSPALPSCGLFDMFPPPSLSDHHDQNDASFAGDMDMLSSDEFNTSWFSDFNFETDTSESLPVATQTDVQLPPLPVLSPTAMYEVMKNNVTASTSGSSLNTSSPNEAGVVANKSVVARAENEDEREFVEGKEAEAEDRGQDRRVVAVENRNDQNQTKKLSAKPKKTDKKKQKPNRVIFKTQTELDHLNDGYRWRKSYYRCTTPGCEVKKHIERFGPKPSMLLISYEGDHTHLAPKVTCASRLEIMHDAIVASVHKIHRKIKTNGVAFALNELPMSQ
ncbi:WRKY transcription factor 23 [Lathyrus oleraceus]|uniref:WRKY domain-containing protein n=1 Tax=Pisum sativum TaxID=3888 RepID=A0A9D4XBD2_PEA|nr:WRKY transcription factor 23-like [Pisum sativum]KAI5415561.1 hypothetical protein KIW84_040836 [Pisum sativum]